MDDAAGSSMLEQAPSRARHTLTVAEVAAQLAEAGVPRSERRIKYFCQSKLLDADKFPTPTGPQWYIDPASVPGLVGDLKQFDEQQRRRLQHAAAGSDTPKEEPTADTAAAGSSRLQPAATGDESTPPAEPAEGVLQQAAAAPAAAYVAQLEKRIEEKDDFIGLLKGQLTAKDEQISELSTRYRETHTLLGAMQRMFAPLLGQADPYVVPEKREATEPPVA
jgi:hypothetical protein